MRIPDDLYNKSPGERRRISPRRFQFHWRQRWRQWINRRLPPQQSIQLNRHNIFIFPTQAGLGFLAFAAILLLVAINFENSSVYALTFLIGGVFTVSILHTFAALMGLKLTGLGGEPSFEGRNAVFEILLSSKGRQHLGVQLSWQDTFSERVDLGKHEEKRLSMRFRTGPRGYCIPGRLKVESCYPLGLVRAWTWIDLNMHTLVYPYPDNLAGQPDTQLLNHDSGSLESPGSDDFYGLRNYITGDSVRSVAWKNYAKSGVLNSKQFVDHIDERMWLDWDAARGNDEQKLRQLCHWALSAEAGHNEYGLRIPGTKLTPARGSVHLAQVLSALATYNLSADKLPASILSKASSQPERKPFNADGNSSMHNPQAAR